MWKESITTKKIFIMLLLIAVAVCLLALPASAETVESQTAAKNAASYQEQGIGIFSMRDDFETIYGDGVDKAD